MLAPSDHINERKGLQNLRSYSVLDTLPEEDYDQLTAIASYISGCPVSLVSLVDEHRQWFKSHHGMEMTETPRQYSFCAHAINQPDEMMIIPDAREDERFKDNPFVTGDDNVIFYAGVKLVDDEGMPLGSFCVIDDQPRVLTEEQTSALKALARQVMNLLELRKNRMALEASLRSLENKNTELEKFALTAAHDLRSPLNSISGLVNLLERKRAGKMDEEEAKMISFIGKSAHQLRKLVDGVLDYSRSDQMLQEDVEPVSSDELKESLESLFNVEGYDELRLIFCTQTVVAHKTALIQILSNLIGNALKYSDKEATIIEVKVTETPSEYCFVVRDNGPGICEKVHANIFELFSIGSEQDRHGNRGSGVGLATVKRLVESMSGTITLTSELGEGCTFSFTITKV